jgi:hypothetical protein
MSANDPSSNTLPAPLAGLPPVRVIGLRPMTKGKLRAFVDIELIRSGFIFRNCAWFRNADDREWLALPSQRYKGLDGVARFTPVVEFSPSAKEPRQRFQDAALSAIHAVMASEGATP